MLTTEKPSTLRIAFNVLVALIFAACLFVLSLSLGFGAEVDLLTSSQILTLSAVVLLVPAMLGISLCFKLLPRHTPLSSMVIVFQAPLGFSFGYSPSRVSDAQLLAVALPLVVCSLVLLLWLQYRSREKKLARYR